jgi:hypothetical protein
MGLLDEFGAWLDQKRRNVAFSVQNPGLLYDRMNEDARQFQQDQRANWGDIKSVVPEVKAAGIKEFNASGQELGGLLGTFAGVGAKTADVAKLGKAKAMVAKGADPVKVWQETGWTDQFPDGKWRFEISDDLMKRKANAPRASTVRGALDHPDLTTAYPDLNRVMYGELGSMQPGAGSFISKGVTPHGELYLGKGGGSEDMKSGLLHEGQHYVQGEEGFARGGSPMDSLLDPYANQLRAKYLEQMAADLAPIAEQRQKLFAPYGGNLFKAPKEVREKGAELEGQAKAIRKKWQDKNPDYEAYKSLAGEAEARLTQSRMNLTPAERAARPPWLEFDIPREQQIVRGLLGEPTGPAMSVAPTKFQLAHAEAQRNAALPVAQGGLGLGPQNTAMERAKAMGFDTPAYHGTKDDVSAFDLSMAGKTDPGLVGRAVYASPSGEQASVFAQSPHYGSIEGNQNVMPLILNLRNSLIANDGSLLGKSLSELHPNGITKQSSRSVKKQVEKSGADSVTFKTGGEDVQYAVFDPQNIRSRFAAFDPKKRDSRDLLASMGLLGLLGAGAYGQEQ